MSQSNKSIKTKTKQNKTKQHEIVKGLDGGHGVRVFVV